VKIIGVTGGIGSGKSVVSRLLEVSYGIPVYNTDLAAKKIYDASSEVKEKLTARFGPELYAPSKRLNRALLASLIFSNPDNRDFVSAVVHPAVEEDFRQWKSRQGSLACAGVESAILFESCLRQWMIDHSVTVSAPLEIRILRTQKRDLLSREAVLSRIRNQMTDEERSALADYTLVNDDRQALLPQVEKWMRLIKSA
jgi:dephospho-CoA kinase